MKQQVLGIFTNFDSFMLVGLLGTVVDQRTTYRNAGACMSQGSAVS